MIKSIILFISLSAQTPMQLDSTLTETEAVALALEKSYEIRLESYNLEIAKNNDTYGNAGFLPTVIASASTSRTTQDAELEFASGDGQSRTGAVSTAQNAGVSLNWTIFDGLTMFATKSRLEQLSQANESIFKAQVQTTISNVQKAFYLAALEQERLKLLRSNLELSEERVAISKEKYEVGRASKMEYLQAQVDYNSDQSDYVRQKETIALRLYELQQIIGLDEKVDHLDLEFAYDLSMVLSREQAEELAISQNPDLQTMEMNQEVSNIFVQELERSRLPSLDFNMGYNYAKSQSEAGFLLSNQTTGLNYGLSARVTLFDGMNQSRQIQNARISAEYNQTNYERYKTTLLTSVRSAFLTYQNAVERADLETKNLEVAEENVSIALERYRVGKSNPLEIREAQNNAVDAQIRHLEALNTAKIAEIELMRLTGEIVK
ncbi:MAG: hypothetical protein CMB80_25770 [Flammeovirgaceae bacterium]|nr:hypothetical protein [Flammeovirgaceae bacterium]MBR09945.1 hypothetical protein [Rickettsiales bacterium]HCX22166.1 hypothetical protein [Cytophagales bacterium]